MFWNDYTPYEAKSQVLTASKKGLLYKAIFTVLFISLLNIKAEAQNQFITKTFEWDYKGYHKAELQIPIGTLVHYASKPRITTGNYADYALEDKGHEYILKATKVICKDADDMGLQGADLIQYLTNFVQQAIQYGHDDATHTVEYAKYGIETLISDSSDCEDSAILLGMLLETCGFDAIPIIYLDYHMAVGVRTDDFSGTRYTYNGKSYVFIEPTSPTPIGSLWGDLPARKPIFEDFKASAFYDRSYITVNPSPVVVVNPVHPNPATPTYFQNDCSTCMTDMSFDPNTLQRVDEEEFEPIGCMTCLDNVKQASPASYTRPVITNGTNANIGQQGSYISYGSTKIAVVQR